jgi:hypothetical protein
MLDAFALTFLRKVRIVPSHLLLSPTDPLFAQGGYHVFFECSLVAPLAGI